MIPSHGCFEKNRLLEEAKNPNVQYSTQSVLVIRKWGKLPVATICQGWDFPLLPAVILVSQDARSLIPSGINGVGSWINVLCHITAAVAESFLEPGAFQQLVVARTAYTECLIRHSFPAGRADFSPSHCLINRTMQLVLGAAGRSRQWPIQWEKSIFTVISSLRFIFLITSLF